MQKNGLSEALLKLNGESVSFGLEDENLIQRQLDMAMDVSHHTIL